MKANYQDIIGNISEEISELQDFHEKLSNLDSDLSYIIDYIENSSLLNSPNGIRKLFKSLSMYSVVRPLKTHLYLELIEHFKTKFKELRPKEIQERCLSFFVELKCIELGLFNPNFQKEHDQARIQYFWPETYKFVIPNLSDQPSEEEVSEYKRLRSIGYNENSIACIIRKDDIDEFQSYLSTCNVDINFIIPKSRFESCPFLYCSEYRELSMIEYAAFYGSINIFKFLWLNNVQINTRIPNVAIAGGNYEIIHLIESKKTLNFDGCLDTAVKFHRNDLFTYLYETYDHQICDTTPFVCIEYYNIFAFSNILSYVVENYNNLKCLVLKLIYGVYFNSFINIFLSMVLHGNYEMIKLLLQSKSNIDINMPDTILSISLIFLLI